MKWIISLFFYIYIPINGFSTKEYARFDYLSIKEGLSQSSVNCILQDKMGLIWIGTQDGLNQYDGYSFTVYKYDPSDTNSLSNNFVYSIHEDDDGYLWIGTNGGLNQLDREKGIFYHYQYTPNNANSLSGDAVRVIYEDSYGFLWVGTEKGGLNCFNKKTKTFTRFQHNLENEFSISSNNIKSIIEFPEKSGIIWIGTLNGGLNVWDRERELFFHFENEWWNSRSLCNNYVRAISSDDYGNLWIGTDNGLSYLSANKVAIPKNRSDAEKLQFINYRYDDSKSSQHNVINANTISALYKGHNRTLWVGTASSGLNKLVLSYKNNNKDSLNENRTEAVPIIESSWFQSDSYYPKSLSNNQVQTIYGDGSGLLWIGTNNGINKYDPTKQGFIHYQHLPNNKNSLNSNEVWSIYEDKDGMIWIGTSDGLNRLDRENNQFTFYPVLQQKDITNNSRQILAIIQDIYGTIWLGTANGLYKSVQVNNNNIALKKIKYKDTPSIILSDDRVYTLYEDVDGMIWVGTKSGLSHINPEKGEYTFYQNEVNNPKSISNNTVRSILRDKSGNLWIGTEGGLNKVINHSNDSISFYCYQKSTTSKNSLSHNMVTSIWEGDNGILWLATYGGGLNRFDPKTDQFSRYTEKNGLSNNVIYGILGDEENNLWLSTNKGISKFNPSTASFTNYEENDGLQSNEFNMGSFYKGRNGELFFGGINGFNVFKANQIKKNVHPPLMIITDFKLFNESVPIGKTSPLKKHISYTKSIVLSYLQNDIAFEFAALHYTAPPKNQYAYKLVGLDKDWHYVNNSREAHYTHLAPDVYTFIVKGTNSDGIECDSVVSIEIIIKPPFWSTLWFRTIAILLFMGIIYSIYLIRINTIKFQKESLERQVLERTEEVEKQKEQIESQKDELEKEKEKSEYLLRNILPQETVDELKSKGKASARHYRTTTVMFTDFKNFTQISEKLSPQQLIAELDKYFIQFDQIIEKYNVEKIKTNGDAYMCVGGLPIRNKSNPFEVVLAGLEIQNYMNQLKEDNKNKGETPWEIRLGIHSGELVAGVVGIKKFAYDIWGDTVNIASRMEENGETGKVNISSATYEIIKEFFQCTHRGKVEAKNKGLIDMYFVEGILPEFSENGESKHPNKMFWEYVNLQLYGSINYRKAEKYIVKRLEEELSDTLHYHGIHHMRDVCKAVEDIALAEGVKGEDIFLLKTAALYHDAGFIKEYADNEPVGVNMANEALPQFGYSQEQIDTVAQLILATKVPQQPKNLLEEIICDADLDYLGRDEFYTISDTLKQELFENGKIKSERQWDELQVKFLTAHRYFTASARESRREKKQQRIAEIKKRLEEDNYDTVKS